MGGPSWEQKSTQNRSDIEVLEGPLLDIVFCAILEGFGTQVGTQNRTQIDQKSTLVAMENTTPKPIREKSPERPEDGSKREVGGTKKHCPVRIFVYRSLVIISIYYIVLLKNMALGLSFTLNLSKGIGMDLECTLIFLQNK